MDAEKIKELLAVLTMPEKEQAKKLAKLYSQDNDGNLIFYPVEKIAQRTFLADLAFRLRDEIWSDYPPFTDKQHCWYNALTEINKKIHTSHWLGGEKSWWMEYAQPIHWIIAALVAKQLAKE
jgi:hypothetical protein